MGAEDGERLPVKYVVGPLGWRGIQGMSLSLSHFMHRSLGVAVRKSSQERKVTVLMLLRTDCGHWCAAYRLFEHDMRILEDLTRIGRASW